MKLAVPEGAGDSGSWPRQTGARYDEIALYGLASAHLGPVEALA